MTASEAREMGTRAWAAFVGGKGDGKEPAIDAFVSELRRLGLSVAGLKQTPSIEGDEVRGYDVVDIATDRCLALARISRQPTLCDLAFDEHAFEIAASWVDLASDIVVVPIGKLEIGHGGHWPLVERIFREARALAVLTVRPHLLAPLALALPDPIASLTLPADVDAIAGFARDVSRGVQATLRE